MGEETSAKNVELVHCHQFLNNSFTLMECFTKACHKMAKYDIYKRTKVDMVRKWHAFLE